MNGESILRDELEKLKDRIIQNMRKAGQVASGDTIKSLRVEVSKTSRGWSGVLFGRPYFGTLESGSKPWRTQYKHPPKFFVDIIAQWMSDKSIKGSAYLTARKIMREGSSLYRKGGRSDIYSNEIPPAIQSIKERFGSFFSTTVQELIKINKP